MVDSESVRFRSIPQPVLYRLDRKTHYRPRFVLIPSSRERHSVRASFSTATYTYYAHDRGMRILRHRRHRPIAAEVFRVPAAEVQQPGLPTGCVASRPQGRVQAASGHELFLIIIALLVVFSFRGNGPRFYSNSARGDGHASRIVRPCF